MSRQRRRTPTTSTHTGTGDSARRPRVLIIAGAYLPGSKAGGPIQSLAAIAHHLGTEIDLFIACWDRDFGDSAPYPDIPIAEWTVTGHARVLYLHPSDFKLKRYRTLLAEIRPDILYLNELYSIRQSVLPATLTRFIRYPPRVIVAPRGCLNPEALKIKRMKKLAYLRTLRAIGLARQIEWHATSNLEASAIRKHMGPVSVVHAPDISIPSPHPLAPPLSKYKSKMRLLFLARISPMKNLPYLLNRIANVRGEISLTIAGPLEDIQHWNLCKTLIARLPKTVQVVNTGLVSREQASALFAAHHFFVLPTLGESYCHSIVESLDSGCPVLISDRTPWSRIPDMSAGWVMPLEDEHAWEKQLQVCCDMDDNDYQPLRSHAKAAHNALIEMDNIKNAYRAMFSLPHSDSRHIR